MYKIEKDKLGEMALYRLKLAGFMKPEDIEQWMTETSEQFSASTVPFSVAMDMRTLMPLSEDALTTMRAAQKQFVARGMVREAVLVHNPVTRLHFEEQARVSGEADWIKYFAATEPDWETAMNDWMEKGQYTESQMPQSPYIIDSVPPAPDV